MDLAFSRIYRRPIDDAIQPKVSHDPAKHATDVKHHEHSDQKSFSDQTVDDSDDRSSYKSETHENDDESLQESNGSGGEGGNEGESGSNDNAREDTPKSPIKHRRCPPGTTLGWDEDARSVCLHGYYTDGF
ncbi:hypothetical protein Ddc_18406 [Ditylenchus destructor]|nr:hypothetical protein Ddc_18406 [Ditylenchus destructor]